MHEKEAEENRPAENTWFKMAVLRKRAKSKGRDFDLQFLIEWIKQLLFDPSKTWVVGLGLLFAEIVVNVVVIWKIKCEYIFLINWQTSVVP